MPTRAPLSCLALLFASPALATPAIDPPISSHSVIQRDKPIELSGTAKPGDRVVLSFAGQSTSARAGPGGNWRVKFAARHAGGPYQISVKASDGIAYADDVMIGDVWLCSGQSNMEYPLRRSLNGDAEVQSADDRDLRLMKVPQQLADAQQPSFSKVPAWRQSTPETARDFSAACFFLARELRKTERVAIGAIDDSWGGTPIRAWMSKTAARSSGETDAADLLDLYGRAPSSAQLRFGDQWARWWRSKTNDAPGNEPWNASNRLAWSAVPSLTYWDNWGPAWKSWIGSAWLRKRVSLTAADAAQPAILSLSAIDDMDQTFINGYPVGGENDPATARSYPVPKGYLRAGANEILVFVRNVWGVGGVAGPADKFNLIFPDGHTTALRNGWEVSRIAGSVGDPPLPPWGNYSGVSTIYNAMVAPLGALSLKGIAWYQGEADVGKPGYGRRLASWMASWRTQFRDPALPFLVVGLAGWGTPVSRPEESGWAALINEQREAVERDPRAALASAIDLGVTTDIHPANKQEVGRRLALAAHQLVYRDGGAVGATPQSTLRQGDSIFVRFSKPLQVLSGTHVNAVELCGNTATSCRFADARVEGASLVIVADKKPITRVRYAWSDFPIVNLYDLDLLPAPVFELVVQ